MATCVLCAAAAAAAAAVPCCRPLPPLLQVHLEVGYKSKISAGQTVLCVTEVESMEGRKVWMKATVRWVGDPASVAAAVAAAA